MGLFDRVKVDDRFKLKLTKADTETINNATSNSDWKMDFQTKDLENWMQDFSIDSKGKLWIYEDPKDKRKRKKFPHTGDVDIYTIITNDDNEHDVDVNITLSFDNGIGKVKTSKVEKHCNKTRLKNEAEFESNRKRYDALRQTNRYKLYRLVYRKPISVTLGALSRFCYKLSTGLQTLKYKLLFW